MECGADKAYRGADGTVRAPCWEQWETLSAGQQAVNRSHANGRPRTERGPIMSVS